MLTDLAEGGMLRWNLAPAFLREEEGLCVAIYTGGHLGCEGHCPLPGHSLQEGLGQGNGEDLRPQMGEKDRSSQMRPEERGSLSRVLCSPGWKCWPDF